MSKVFVPRRGDLLAHRGAWTRPDEKNSRAAIERALLDGFGLETDIRDMDGTLVISHDPPRSDAGELLTLDWLFDLYAKNACTGVLALNIKADGLAAAIKAQAEAHGVSNYVAFDMSVPDTLAYMAEGMPFYTRISEYETEPAFLDECVGVWIDNFTGTYDQVAAARTVLAAGKAAAFVSPELHRRDHAAFWATLAETDWPEGAALQICTDFPTKCEDFFKAGT